MTYNQIIAYAAGESQADTSHVESCLQDSPELAETVSRFRGARAAMQADDSVAPPAELIAQAKALFVAPKPQRLLGAWSLTHSRADLNADGSVGSDDLILLLGNWGG